MRAGAASGRAARDAETSLHVRAACEHDHAVRRAFGLHRLGHAFPHRLVPHELREQHALEHRGLHLGVVCAEEGEHERAVLRVVDPNDTAKTVDYDTWGRVELTTLTKEFFMPRFLERDEALRRKPRAPYAWDGVAEVRPFGAMTKTIVEGVY